MAVQEEEEQVEQYGPYNPYTASDDEDIHNHEEYDPHYFYDHDYPENNHSDEDSYIEYQYYQQPLYDTSSVPSSRPETPAGFDFTLYVTYRAIYISRSL